MFKKCANIFFQERGGVEMRKDTKKLLALKKALVGLGLGTGVVAVLLHGHQDEELELLGEVVQNNLDKTYLDELDAMESSRVQTKEFVIGDENILVSGQNLSLLEAIDQYQFMLNILNQYYDEYKNVYAEKTGSKCNFHSRSNPVFFNMIGMGETADGKRQQQVQYANHLEDYWSVIEEGIQEPSTSLSGQVKRNQFQFLKYAMVEVSREYLFHNQETLKKVLMYVVKASALQAVGMQPDEVGLVKIEGNNNIAIYGKEVPEKVVVYKASGELGQLVKMIYAIQDQSEELSLYDLNWSCQMANDVVKSGVLMEENFLGKKKLK